MMTESSAFLRENLFCKHSWIFLYNPTWNRIFQVDITDLYSFFRSVCNTRSAVFLTLIYEYLCPFIWWILTQLRKIPSYFPVEYWKAIFNERITDPFLRKLNKDVVIFVKVVKQNVRIKYVYFITLLGNFKINMQKCRYAIFWLAGASCHTKKVSRLEQQQQIQNYMKTVNSENILRTSYCLVEIKQRIKNQWESWLWELV